MVHDLKTWPEYFEGIKNGSKNFELRYNDSTFQVGDFLCLKEWVQHDVFSSYDAHDPKEDDGQYTGNEVMVRVTYILQGAKFGLQNGHCIMSITHDEKGWEAIAKSNLAAYQDLLNSDKNDKRSVATEADSSTSVENQIQKQYTEKGNQLGSIVGKIPDLPMNDAIDSFKEKHGSDAVFGFAFKKGAEFGLQYASSSLSGVSAMSGEEMLNKKCEQVGLIDFNNALKHHWLKQWDSKSLKRVFLEAMEQYASARLKQKEEANDVMGKILMERDGEIEQLQSSVDKYKKLAEEIIEDCRMSKIAGGDVDEHVQEFNNRIDTAIRLLNKDQNVKVSDTTGDDSSTNAGNQKSTNESN